MQKASLPRSSKGDHPIARLLLVFVPLIAVVLGCGSIGNNVKTPGRACSTGDGSLMAFIDLQTAFVVDGATGERISVEKPGPPVGVLCGDKKLGVVTPTEVIEFPSGKVRKRPSAGNDIVGWRGDDELVVVSYNTTGPSNRQVRVDMKVAVQKLDSDERQPSKEFVLSQFQGLDQSGKDYSCGALRVINDRDLLVGCNTSPGSPWGFYLVDPVTGIVKNFGAPKPSDPNPRGWGRSYASRDGSIIACGRTYGDVGRLEIWSNYGNDLSVDKTLDGAVSEVTDIIVSEDSRSVAVLLKEIGKDVTYRVEVYDTKSGAKTGGFRSAGDLDIGSTDFLRFADGYLTLEDYQMRMAKVEALTGGVVWQKTPGKQ